MKKLFTAFARANFLFFVGCYEREWKRLRHYMSSRLPLVGVNVFLTFFSNGVNFQLTVNRTV